MFNIAFFTIVFVLLFSYQQQLNILLKLVTDVYVVLNVDNH